MQAIESQCMIRVVASLTAGHVHPRIARQNRLGLSFAWISIIRVCPQLLSDSTQNQPRTESKRKLCEHAGPPATWATRPHTEPPGCAPAPSASNLSGSYVQGFCPRAPGLVCPNKARGLSMAVSLPHTPSPCPAKTIPNEFPELTAAMIWVDALSERK
jgi:hypothetical protein